MRVLMTICLMAIYNLVLAGPIDTMAFKTPEGVCNKMIEFISFDKGEEKDWDEYRNLFLPNAQKMSFRAQPGASLARQARASNIEEFVRNYGPSYPEKGFEEYAIGVEVQEFNGIANVFQSFYCKTPDGSYEARGVNAFQVVYLNDRWWIASSMFVNESDEIKLPDALLFPEYRSNVYDLTNDQKVRNHSEYDQVYEAMEDYVLGLYNTDQSKIQKSIDSNLRKVGYWYDLKNQKENDNLEMTFDQLYELSGEWNKTGSEANENSIRTITIFDISDKIAIGKLNAVWGIDHFQLAKVENQWKIMNVIWEGKG